MVEEFRIHFRNFLDVEIMKSESEDQKRKMSEPKQEFS